MTALLFFFYKNISFCNNDTLLNILIFNRERGRNVCLLLNLQYHCRIFISHTAYTNLQYVFAIINLIMQIETQIIILTKYYFISVVLSF